MEEEPARMAREARRTLDDQVRRIEAAGGKVAEAHLRVGGAPEEIVALAEDLGAGVVVMGSRGRGGIRRALMGSVSGSVVRHAHCPVLIVRKKSRTSGSANSERGAWEGERVPARSS
jgi:nucleotide-binding universal stress UspA family protein